jgi:DNA-binding GntR family transcriptional regulator
MRYFEVTRDDGRPLWKVIYDDIQGKLHTGELKVGDTLSHET